MKRVDAYKDSNGGLHETKTNCAIQELRILSLPEGHSTEAMCATHATKLVQNRKAVITALEAIDLIEALPATPTYR